MSPIDWLIVVAIASAAIGGFRLGFITRASSWIGTIAGFISALLLLSPVLHQAQNVTQGTRLGITILLLVAGSLLGQMLGLFLGARLTVGMLGKVGHRIDQVSGAFLGIAGVILALWFVLPVAANVPGISAQTVRQSAIASAIYNSGPRIPDPLVGLQRLAGANGFPSVFEGIGESPEAGPAPTSVTLTEAVIANTSASTVKVEGIACRRTQDGTGFVIAPNLIATNAHVVAGEDHTSVIDNEGKDHAATVVAFDPDRDIALLSVPSFTAPPLRLDDAHIGDIGAVFGHPGGIDELVVSPAAVSSEIIALGRDLYDRHRTERDVLILAAPLHPGDSGGPLVDSDGNVIGIAFAIAPDKPNTSYALSTSELSALLAVSHNTKVDTGRCIDD
jgi:S1-C subfamily serine protease